MKKLLLVLAAFGCGGGDSKRGSTLPDAPVTSKSFDLTFQAFADANGAQRPVDPGATLKSGDKIALSVSLTRPAYIYIVQFFPDGSAEVLFPSAGEERAAEGTTRVPGTGWFQLDDAVGEENVYIVAAEPIAQADAAVKKTVDLVRTTHKAPEVAEPAPVEPVATEPAKTEPVKTEPVKTEPAKTEPVEAKAPVKRVNTVGAGKRPAPGLTNMRERGLKRVESGSTIRASADEGGVVVFRFSFNHAAK